MKSKIPDKKRKLFRAILGTLSFTSALFVFQACYGSPEDFSKDFYIEGKVKAKSSELPIPGIKVSIESNSQFGYTDSGGQFRIYVSQAAEYIVTFEDVDSDKNGSFLPLTSTIKLIDESVVLNVTLNEK